MIAYAIAAVIILFALYSFLGTLGAGPFTDRREQYGDAIEISGDRNAMYLGPKEPLYLNCDAISSSGECAFVNEYEAQKACRANKECAGYLEDRGIYTLARNAPVPNTYYEKNANNIWKPEDAAYVLDANAKLRTCGDNGASICDFDTADAAIAKCEDDYLCVGFLANNGIYSALGSVPTKSAQSKIRYVGKLPGDGTIVPEGRKENPLFDGLHPPPQVLPPEVEKGRPFKMGYHIPPTWKTDYSKLTGAPHIADTCNGGWVKNTFGDSTFCGLELSPGQPVPYMCRNVSNCKGFIGEVIDNDTTRYYIVNDSSPPTKTSFKPSHSAFFEINRDYVSP